MHTILSTVIKNNQAAVEGFVTSHAVMIEAFAARCAGALKADRKLLFCGNGGSACDAMHIAGEFVGRYIDDRRSLPAIALSADTGIITAIANDYAYDYIFARQVEGLGQTGDVLIAMSTSGRSPNVVRALQAAKEKGITTALFTGEKVKQGAAPEADFVFIVPSVITAHVQEAHMVVMHALASLIETDLKAAGAID